MIWTYALNAENDWLFPWFLAFVILKFLLVTIVHYCIIVILALDLHHMCWIEALYLLSSVVVSYWEISSLQNGIRALGQLKYLAELNISHLETLTSQSVDEALGKEPRPSLQVLYLASLPLEWKTIARLASVTPNLVHLDVSMCVSGINNRSIQVRTSIFSMP